MEWTTTLERFGTSLGIDHLAPDVHSSCSLLFDGRYEVTFTHDEDDRSLLMYCELGDASRLSRESCLTLLKASLLGAETGGAALSIHDAVDQVVLWKRFDEDTLNADTMRNAVNDFLAQVTVWKQRLQELGSVDTEYGSSGTDMDTMNNFGMFV